MQTYVIQGKILNWIKEYLIKCEQKVKISDTFSNEIKNNHSVPQGSILGPLLFITYINNKGLYIDCHFINLFADTLVVCNSKFLSEAIDNMILVLSIANTYFPSKKLKSI